MARIKGLADTGGLIRRAVALWALACVGFLGLPAPAQAKNGEDKAFKAAYQEFSDKQYGQAEIDFTAFLNTYSNSPHAPEAALCMAQARLSQSNFSGAINALQEHLAQAGELTPYYIFYIAKATNALGDFRMAATGLANLIKQAPPPPLLIEAAYDEAEAWSKLSDWPKVIELLGNTNAAFQGAARAAGASNEFAASGQLLLSKAYLRQGQAAAGEAALHLLPPSNLSPSLAWERQFLLCQLQLAQGKDAEAESNSTNLLALTQSLGASRRAASLALRGAILERRNKWAEAVDSYTNNLAEDNLPEAVQRESLARAVVLMLGAGQTNAATQLLEGLAQRPGFAAQDLVRLNLGELWLTAYAAQMAGAAVPPGTNPASLLARAGTNFESVIRDFPNSPARGRAHLDYGWRLWVETNVAGARTNFFEAAARLPHSEDQAVALFKLADAEMREQDYAGALSNYDRLIGEYSDNPSVTNKLFDLALYKILEASLATHDEARASAAAGRIMAWFPTTYYGGHGLLLRGEDLTRKNNYETARQEFGELIKKPTPLQAEAEYAIARTYGLEGRWAEALPLYNAWVAHHPEDALLPRVEYDRALACEKTGQGTNALALMTNFVARFSTHALAPWAQNWIADYYFNLGDFPKAEINYEELYGKWPNAGGDLAYWARLGAGRAALGRQDPGEARKYFSDLVSLPGVPPDISAQGYFALGDTLLQQFSGEPTNTAFLDQAIAAVSKLTNGAPTNVMAALAYGRLGDYYLQGKDASGASQMYRAALACSNVLDAASRSQLEIALGKVAVATKQPQEALQHFNNVLYHSDQTDPFWIVQAGTEAAGVLEDSQQWEAAVNVYKRVLTAAPYLRPTLEKKIAAAQQKMDAAQNGR